MGCSNCSGCIYRQRCYVLGDRYSIKDKYAREAHMVGCYSQPVLISFCAFLVTTGEARKCSVQNCYRKKIKMEV